MINPFSKFDHHDTWRRNRILMLTGTSMLVLSVLLIILLGPWLGQYLTPEMAYTVNKAVVMTLTITFFTIFLFLLITVRFKYLKYGFFALLIISGGAYTCGGHSWRAKISEGVNISIPHRTALGIDCAEMAMQRRSVKEFHQHVGLSPPASYVGTYIESVRAETENMLQGRITITLSKIIVDETSWPIPIVVAKPGDVLIYRGTCTPDGMSWSIRGTVPEIYLRRFSP